MKDEYARYRLGTEENKTFQEEAREELFSFGHRISSPGGGIYWLGDDGTPWKEKPRETYTTARMVHVYCLGMMLGHKGSEELAANALLGLTDGELKDKENGGWFSGVDAEGKPLPDKMCYAHAFVILAASSALLAGLPGAEELLEEAERVYDRYFWDEEAGMARDIWDTGFHRCDPYRGLNANMHSVEAFLAAADATGDERYRRRAGRVIERVLGFARNNSWRLIEHYSEDWIPMKEFNQDRPDDQFKPYGATPGHGIEWSRLITQWALSTYRCNPDLASSYLHAAEHLFGRAVADGWNADGQPGIVYTTNWRGEPVVHDRMYWTLAEGIGASANLAHATSRELYEGCYFQFQQYLDDKVRDHEHGSWFHQLDRNNRLTDTVWPGKPDLYHAVQSTIIPFYTPDTSIACAVKNRILWEK